MRVKKTAVLVCAAAFALSQAVPQETDFSDFSGFSDFSDDDLFADENIEELDESAPSTGGSAGTFGANLAHGILFETGSVRIGGSFDTGLETYTVLYDGTADEQASFGDNIAATRLAPSADAQVYIDARASQTLRMYTKFGVRYPYTVTATSYPVTTTYTAGTALLSFDLPVTTGVTTSIANSFYVKELFTDFSLANRAFFRFGLHTVTWGTGYFFSPVSDMINTSAINPEDTDEQVNGSLNLRTQITFPGTQNCLWLYVIPDSVTNSISAERYASTSLSTYTAAAQYPYDAKKTAFAAKGDIVLGGWELGLGAFFKWQSVPKAMLTASGSIINGKVSVFGEAVYRYGSNAEWSEAPESWKDKTSIFQATAGASYYWKAPLITFAAQYYYDGNKGDHEYYTYGHNVAGTVSFGRIGTTNFTATLFGLFYLGKEKVSGVTQTVTLLQEGTAFMPYAGIASAMFYYSPRNEIKIGAGPYITWESMQEKPVVSLKLTATLGGGKF